MNVRLSSTANMLLAARKVKAAQCTLLQTKITGAGYGIVGGQTPLGTGLGYALKYQGLEGCSLCFLGDGAINQGAFHESLNLAALFDLPAGL